MVCILLIHVLSNPCSVSANGGGVSYLTDYDCSKIITFQPLHKIDLVTCLSSTFNLVRSLHRRRQKIFSKIQYYQRRCGTTGNHCKL
ncbi:hypothetical protein KC19_3G225300 [Ceratodon purpureus]|uniref:Secreted protein n=1 Tax=Ceratodon purpureus TaxID=3225 RepID=A0A8T0IQH8_CERPU|nr:hypothetical protein KC19_3G225300 [Ceratodon purpureus]